MENITRPDQIRINPFVRRQTPESGFTHHTLTDGDLIQRVFDSWENQYYAYPGHTGIILVNVPPEGFFSGMVALTPNRSIGGVYEARQKGEDPRKRYYIDAGLYLKPPARTVEVVLYCRTTLTADGEDPRTLGDWNIIAINSSPVEVDRIPIDPDTLMANHFGISGGTSTGMTPEQFEIKLREAFLFWRDKILLGP